MLAEDDGGKKAEIHDADLLILLSSNFCDRYIIPYIAWIHLCFRSLGSLAGFGQLFIFCLPRFVRNLSQREPCIYYICYNKIRNKHAPPRLSPCCVRGINPRVELFSGALCPEQGLIER